MLVSCCYHVCAPDQSFSEGLDLEPRTPDASLAGWRTPDTGMTYWLDTSNNGLINHSNTRERSMSC